MTACRTSADNVMLQVRSLNRCRQAQIVMYRTSDANPLSNAVAVPANSNLGEHNRGDGAVDAHQMIDASVWSQ